MDSDFDSLCNRVIAELSEEQVKKIVEEYADKDATIKISRDLLQYMKNELQISPKNVEKLRELLKSIKRSDLVVEVEKYQMKYPPIAVDTKMKVKVQVVATNLKILPTRSKDYIPREQESTMKWLCALPKDCKDKTRYYAIAGQAGVGKTQLAINFCKEVKDDFAIVWFQIGDCFDTLLLHFRELLEKLGISCAKKSPQQYAKEFEDKVTKTGSKWLIVLDNFDKVEISDILDLFPKKGGMVLLTSDESEALEEDKTIEIKQFSEDEVVAYFRKVLYGICEFDRAKAVQVGALLGNNPFKVSVAAWYLMDICIDEKGGDTTEYMATEMDKLIRDMKGGKKQEKGANALCDVAIARLKHKDPGAWQLMRKLSLLNSSGVSDAVAVGMTPSQDKALAHKHLRSIRSLSLMESRRGDGGQVVHVLHRLMRNKVREKVEEEPGGHIKSVEEAISGVYRLYEKDLDVESAWQQNQELAEHVDALWGSVDGKVSLERRGQLVEIQACYIQFLIDVLGDLENADLLLTRLEGKVEKGMKNWYKERPLYARGMIRLRKLDLRGALEQFNAGLELCRQTGTSEGNLDRARYLTVIGTTHYLLEQPEKALEEYKDALTLYMFAHSGGEEGPNVTVANMYRYMAMCYVKLQQWREALGYYKNCLEIHWKICSESAGKEEGAGEEIATEEIAALYLAIGECYDELHMLDAALEHYNAALRIQQRLFPGEERPEIGDSYLKIGAIYVKAEKFAFALPLFEKSHRIFSSQFDDKHPAVQASITCIQGCAAKLAEMK